MPATITPIQTSFAFGELSPRLSGHSDLQAYQNGVSLSENFVPVSQGPLFGREGTRFIDTFTGSYGRVFSFPVSHNEAYFVVLTDDGQLYVVDEGGRYAPDNLLTNGDFSDGGTGWTATTAHPSASVLFLDGLCVMTHGSAADRSCTIYQQVTGANASNLHKFIVLQELTNEVTVRISSTLGVGDIYEGSYNLSEINIDFTPGVTSFYVEIESVGTDTVREINYVIVADLVVAISAYPQFPTPYNANDLSVMQRDMPPEGLTMYFVTPTKAPYKLTYIPSTKTWDFTIVTFTAQPASWTGTNWPKTLTFFQGRSWWGGTNDTPNTFWASKSGSYEDLTTGTQADDAMEYDLSERGAIQWMLGLKTLLIGSSTGEHIVTSEGKVVIPGDIVSEKQSGHGSRYIQAHTIGNRALYVTSDGRKLRDLGYVWTEEGWLSRDITFLAEHITEGDSITKVEWLEHPENLIMCLTQRGRWLSCTYDRANNIVGWARHFTEGSVVDITHNELNGSSVFAQLTKREGVSGALYLELYPNFTSTLAEQSTFLDSHVVQVGEKRTAISGVTHLANMTVRVITDGAVHPDVTLDGSGNGTLQWEAEVIIVGLRYLRKMRTLALDNRAVETGSTMTYVKRWNKIFVRIISSLKPKINGVRPPERHPSTPMDEGEPPISEDVEVMTLGPTRQALVTIEQDLPVATNIVALFGEVGQDIL